MYMLISIEEVNKKNKRFIATFKDGTTTRFGQIDGDTFLDHNDNTKRENYVKRHIRDLRTKDPKRAGFLSMFILWNKSTLIESVNDYMERYKTNKWDMPR